MKQLKQMGMNSDGFLTFYKTNVKPVLSYAAPVWYTFLTEHDKAKLEKLQKTSSKIVLTEVDDYFSRLDQLNLLKTDEFLFSVCAHYLSKGGPEPSSF